MEENTRTKCKAVLILTRQTEGTLHHRLWVPATELFGNGQKNIWMKNNVNLWRRDIQICFERPLRGGKKFNFWTFLKFQYFSFQWPKYTIRPVRNKQTQKKYFANNVLFLHLCPPVNFGPARATQIPATARAARNGELRPAGVLVPVVCAHGKKQLEHFRV